MEISAHWGNFLCCFFIFLEHIYSKNLLPLPTGPPACPPEGLPWNPGLQVVPPVPKSEECSFPEQQGIIHRGTATDPYSGLCPPGEQILSYKSCFVVPRLGLSVQDFIPSQVLHLASNPGLTLEMGVATSECQLDPESLPLSPAAQAVLHIRDQNHPKSPVPPK